MIWNLKWLLLILFFFISLYKTPLYPMQALKPVLDKIRQKRKCLRQDSNSLHQKQEILAFLLPLLPLLLFLSLHFLAVRFGGHLWREKRSSAQLRIQTKLNFQNLGLFALSASVSSLVRPFRTHENHPEICPSGKNDRGRIFALTALFLCSFSLLPLRYKMSRVASKYHYILTRK